jgi:hypothetical protein
MGSAGAASGVGLRTARFRRNLNGMPLERHAISLFKEGIMIHPALLPLDYPSIFPY